MLLAIFFILPLLKLLPYAALAPIIILGALNVISFGEFKTAFQVDAKEGVVMVATFVVSLASDRHLPMWAETGRWCLQLAVCPAHRV